MITGDLIKTLRKQNKLTQEELAEMVYTTRQAISNYERGLRECPNSIEELILEKLNYSICVKNNTEISKKKDEKMYKFNVFSAPNKEIPKVSAANPNVISTLKAGDNIIQKINYFGKKRYIVLSKASDTSYFYVIDESGKRLSIENFNYIQFFEENTPFLPGGIFKAENIDGNKCYLDIDCNVIPKALVINSFYVGGGVRVSYNVNTNIYTLQFADRENFNEEIFDDVKIFSDNLFIVYKEGKCGLINSKKETIIPIEQSYILRCDRKTFWVEKEHKSYFTSEKGDVVGEIFNFGTNEIISRLSLNRYRKVLIDEKKYIFDVKTNKKMKIDTDYIGLYFDDKFFVRNGDKKGIIDFNKNVILPIEFEYIDPHPQINKYISLKKDDKLYISYNNFNLTSFPYVEGKYIFKYHSDLRVHYIKYDNEKLFIILQTNKDKSIVRTKFIGTYEELIKNLVSHNDNTQYYDDYRQAIDDMRKSN